MSQRKAKRGRAKKRVVRRRNVKNETTISFEEKKRTNDIFTISCELNRKKASVQVDPELGVLVSKIEKSFRWTKTQAAGVIIVGLKNHEGNSVYFKECKELAMEQIIGGRTRFKKRLFLLPGHKYNLIIEDCREKAVEMMTPSDMEEIRKSFNNMDLNGDGVVEIHEIEEFHRMEMEKKLEEWKVWVKEKIKRRREMKKAYEMVMHEGIERDKEIRNRNIKYYKEHDVDHDGEVSWEEFVAAEAVLRIAKRVKKGKPRLATEKRASSKKKKVPKKSPMRKRNKSTNQKNRLSPGKVVKRRRSTGSKKKSVGRK